MSPKSGDRCELMTGSGQSDTGVRRVERGHTGQIKGRQKAAKMIKDLKIRGKTKGMGQKTKDPKVQQSCRRPFNKGYFYLNTSKGSDIVHFTSTSEGFS